MKKIKSKYDSKFAISETNPEFNKDMEQQKDIQSEDDLDIIFDETYEQNIDDHEEKQDNESE